MLKCNLINCCYSLSVTLKIFTFKRDGDPTNLTIENESHLDRIL